MIAEHNHCSNALLQEYIDGVLSDRVRVEVAAHLASCDSCRRSAAAFRRLDDALRSVPHEVAGARFTHSVMEGIGGARHSDADYRLLIWAGGAVGMTIVSGVVVAILFSTGVLDFGLTGEGESSGPSWPGVAPGMLTRFFTGGFELVEKYLSILSSLGGFPVWMFAAAVVGTLGVADFLLQRRVGDR